MGDVTNREFTLAGWGVHGEANFYGDNDYSHLDYELFLRGGEFNRGSNRVDKIVDNLLVYNMSYHNYDPSKLNLEAVAFDGDDGSGALVNIPELGN